MQIKVAMLDDDVNALPIIAGAANSAFRAKGMSPEITCFRSGKALLKALETTAFQLVMLDIEMPDMDGIAVGKAIRERGMEVPIVYVSECENRVFDSFQVRPLGFVRKSNFLNDIAAVTELYLKTCAQKSTGEYLEFQTRSGLLTLKSKQIRYIEGSRNYQLLYTVSGKEPIEVKMTMDKLEAMTEPYGFLRIHKGYLVNYQSIQRIFSTTVILQDGTELPVGRSKAADIKSKFLSLLGK